jgi:C4-dicarboxylate transporter DctQ subunit
MLKLLDHLEEWLIATLMAAATLLIFVAVVHRYAAGWPIPVVQDFLIKLNLAWAQELCIYMFVWMAKFGAAYGVRTGIHVGVDVLINRPSRRTPAVLHPVRTAAGALFTAIVGHAGATFVWDMAHTDSVSPDLELPQWMVYLCMPLGSYLMCFRFLQVAWSSRRRASCRATTKRRSRASTIRTCCPRICILSPCAEVGDERRRCAAPQPRAALRVWPRLLPAPVIIALPLAVKLAGVPINNAWIIFTLLIG